MRVYEIVVADDTGIIQTEWCPFETSSSRAKQKALELWNTAPGLRAVMVARYEVNKKIRYYVPTGFARAEVEPSTVAHKKHKEGYVLVEGRMAEILNVITGEWRQGAKVELLLGHHDVFREHLADIAAVELGAAP